MRIGLDIDGVLYNWHYSVYRYFCEFRGFSGSQREFWMYVRSLPEGTFDYYVKLPLLYIDTSPSTDVIVYLPKIAEIAEIFYITARTEELKPATSKFFDNYRFPFKENVIFSKNKQNYARLLKLDYFLDDQPYHIDELKSVTNAYLFKAVHNWESRELYPLMNSMKEFYEFLLSKQKETKLIKELGY